MASIREIFGPPRWKKAPPVGEASLGEALGQVDLGFTRDVAIRRRYPIPIVKPDLTGGLKMRTLEFFVFNPEWHSSKDVYCDPILGHPLYGSGWRCLSIRLLRYHRDDLLARRRSRKGYEYQIKEKGMERLIHLWERFGCFEAKDDVNRELADRKRKLAEMRLRIAIWFENKQLLNAEKKMRELDEVSRKDFQQLLCDTLSEGNNMSGGSLDEIFGPPKRKVKTEHLKLWD